MIKRRILYAAAALALLGYFIWFQNNAITVTKSEISSSTIPAAFDQYKIVHLSDLHNKSFGKKQERLVRKVRKLQPDIIVYTGDLIDSNRAGDEAGLILMEELTVVAPVYYVTGNHEWWSETFSSLESSLEDIGVKVLRNEHDALVKGNDQIVIAGIDDPAYDGRRTERETAEEDIVKSTDGIVKDSFTILLSHRSELFPLYSKRDLDLVFAGHAHGGQFRIPFIGGLVAPDQGFLPTYTAGKHELNHTVMMVSRGLGNSIIPLRLFNRPDIVAVTLKATGN